MPAPTTTHSVCAVQQDADYHWVWNAGASAWLTDDTYSHTVTTLVEAERARREILGQPCYNGRANSNTSVIKSTIRLLTRDGFEPRGHRVDMVSLTMATNVNAAQMVI